MEHESDEVHDDPKLDARAEVLQLFGHVNGLVKPRFHHRRGGTSQPVTICIGQSGNLGCKPFVDRDQGIGPIGKCVTQIARRLKGIRAHLPCVGIVGENLL